MDKEGSEGRTYDHEPEGDDDGLDPARCSVEDAHCEILVASVIGPIYRSSTRAKPLRPGSRTDAMIPPKCPFKFSAKRLNGAPILIDSTFPEPHAASSSSPAREPITDAPD